MGTMPDVVDEPDDPDYRFVVLGHPELGEFLDWDEAVAAAWTVTPAGAKRADVTLAHKGVEQFRTQDPDPDDVLGWILPRNGTSWHAVKRASELATATTWCGVAFGRLSFKHTDDAPPLTAQCLACNIARGKTISTPPMVQRIGTRIEQVGIHWSVCITVDGSVMVVNKNTFEEARQHLGRVQDAVRELPESAQSSEVFRAINSL